MEFNATFIVTIISFLVFLFIMKAIFYKPLEEIVAERQKFVDDNYKEATWLVEKATSLLNNKEKELSQSKQEAKQIISEKSEAAKAKKSEITKSEQQNSIQKIDTAKQELHESKNQAQEVLDQNVLDLAQDISAKIIGK